MCPPDALERFLIIMGCARASVYMCVCARACVSGGRRTPAITIRQAYTQIQSIGLKIYQNTGIIHKIDLKN